MQMYKGIIDSPGRSERSHAFEVPDNEKPVEGVTRPLCDRKKRILVRLLQPGPIPDVSHVTCGVCQLAVRQRKPKPEPKKPKKTISKAIPSASAPEEAHTPVSTPEVPEKPKKTPRTRKPKE